MRASPPADLSPSQYSLSIATSLFMIKIKNNPQTKAHRCAFDALPPSDHPYRCPQETGRPIHCPHSHCIKLTPAVEVYVQNVHAALPRISDFPIALLGTSDSPQLLPRKHKGDKYEVAITIFTTLLLKSIPAEFLSLQEIFN